MPGQSTPSKDDWPTPILNRAGQKAFWDRQAPDYDQADMTRDNEGELDLVRALCQQFCLEGYVAEDVVTLGGAVGSRDPGVVTEVLERYSQWPSHIYFNDLSESMTEQALKGALNSYPTKQTQITVLSGPIHEISRNIPSIPRRVIIGVYRMESFTTANPHYGYPLTGLEEYEKNADKVGTHLLIEPVCVDGDSYTDIDVRIVTSTDDTSDQKKHIYTRLSDCIDVKSIDAIRIVGRHRTCEGFFLSHWFSEIGIRKLITASFGFERLSSMSLMPCAKGFVLCIDPLEQPRGIVTILNNVVGNILPDEQIHTLRAIDKLSR